MSLAEGQTAVDLGLWSYTCSVWTEFQRDVMGREGPRHYEGVAAAWAAAGLQRATAFVQN